MTRKADDERLRELERIRQSAERQARFAAEDSSRLFALLALETIPVETLDDVSETVSREIRREGAPARRIAGGSGWVAAGALAAGLVLAALLGLELRREAAVPVAFGPEPAALVEAAALELLSSRGAAQVVDLTVGDTQVVMIFDEGLDL